MNKQKVSWSTTPVEIPQHILQEYKDWKEKKIRFSVIGQKKYTAMRNRFSIYGLHQPVPRRKNAPDKQKFDEDRKKRRRDYMRKYQRKRKKQKLLEQANLLKVTPIPHTPVNTIVSLNK